VNDDACDTGSNQCRRLKRVTHQQNQSTYLFLAGKA
jgi:hypothetical protein